MSVLLGVIFFMLIQASLNHGPQKGWVIASGVISGDILFVILAIGFTRYIQEFLTAYEPYVNLVGGLVLLVIGISNIRKKRGNPDLGDAAKEVHSTRDFYFKPFLINLLNPANAMWWLGLYSVRPAVHYDLTQKIIFASGAIGAVFFTEVAIAYAASGLRRYITAERLQRVDVTVGLVLMGFGVWLFIKAGAGFWA
ncbi:MAG: LysE family translocator [Bacteroidota bacterium]|jgi:threonine/homoserine/homoserine lactone efflux protein